MRGKSRLGIFIVVPSNLETYIPIETCLTTSTIFFPKAGPMIPSKQTSLLSLLKFTSGKHPATISFFSFGTFFSKFTIRFSVGAFTAHVLYMISSAFWMLFTMVWPALERQPVRISASARLLEQPKLLTYIRIAAPSS